MTAVYKTRMRFFMIPFREQYNDYGRVTIMSAVAFIQIMSKNHDVKLFSTKEEGVGDFKLGAELSESIGERAWNRMSMLSLPLRAEMDPQMRLIVKCTKSGNVVKDTMLCFPSRSQGENIEPEFVKTKADLREWCSPTAAALQVQMQSLHDTEMVYSTLQMNHTAFLQHVAMATKTDSKVMWMGKPDSAIPVIKSYTYTVQVISQKRVVREISVNGRQILYKLRAFAMACTRLLQENETKACGITTIDPITLGLTATGLMTVETDAKMDVCEYDGCMTPMGRHYHKMRSCADCRLVRYCSRQCQKSDWKAHKKNCASCGLPSTTTGGNAMHVRLARNCKDDIVLDVVSVCD